MNKLENLEPQKVFYFFEQICAIPHGSGNMQRISQWCVDFAKARGLKYIKDDACNVIIFKEASKGFENRDTVILQGHLDMVCQKNEGFDFDFESQGLDLFVDGDYIGAQNTTLGGDDGIGAAMILALLDSDDIPHPPIEAVFTTDEEIGMLGASALDMSVLKGKYMINLDSENIDTVTVSCAGGEDVCINVPLSRHTKRGFVVNITLENLLGGHSGVEIDKNRSNASVLLGRVLNHLKLNTDFCLVTLSGGDKTNAITKRATAEILTSTPEKVKALLEECLEALTQELSTSEPNFSYSVNVSSECDKLVIDKDTSYKIINFLALFSQGVVTMSAEIQGLVETSHNLGIMQCDNDSLNAAVSLRSSRASAMNWLEERLYSLAAPLVAKISVSGIYPPWEYLKDSRLRDIWCKYYEEETGDMPKVEAIHAGLECGVFSSALRGLDCISVGPELKDIHTPDEKLGVSSVATLWKILLKVISNLT